MKRTILLISAATISLAANEYLNFNAVVSDTVNYECLSDTGNTTDCPDLIRGEPITGGFISMGSCVNSCGPTDGICHEGTAYAKAVAGECGFGQEVIPLNWTSIPVPENCSSNNEIDYELDLTHTGCVMEVGIFSKEDGKTLFITDFAYKGNTPNVIFNIVCNGIDSAPLRSAVTCTALTGQQPKNGNITFTTIDTTTRSIAWLASTGTPGDVKWTPTSNVIFTLGFRYVLPAEFVDFLDLSYQFEIEGSVHEDPQTVRILNKPPPAPLLNPTPSSRIMCNTWDNGAAFLCNVEMRDDIGPVRVVEKTPWDKFNFLITTEGCSSTGMKIAGFKAGVASNFDFEVRRLTPCAVVDINVTISAKIEGKVLSRLLENGSYAHTPFEFSGEAVTPTAVPTTAPTPAPHHKSGELKDIEIVLAVLGSGVFIATIIYCIRVHRQKTDEKQRAESWAPILNESESPSPTAGRVDRGASVVSRGRAQSTLEEIECGGPAAELENKDAFVATADELAE